MHYSLIIPIGRTYSSLISVTVIIPLTSDKIYVQLIRYDFKMATDDKYDRQIRLWGGHG